MSHLWKNSRLLLSNLFYDFAWQMGCPDFHPKIQLVHLSHPYTAISIRLNFSLSSTIGWLRSWIKRCGREDRLLWAVLTHTEEEAVAGCKQSLQVKILAWMIPQQ